MNDREKLIALIKAATDYSCVLQKLKCTTTEADEDPLIAMADHLLANGVTIQRWIPVTERLPDETRDEYVLVVCDYYGKIKVETRKMWHIDACVTHWMPLPEPPKEVE